MNLILIGMPGCGKSTVGVVLAKALGMDFIDSDLVIQKAEGMRLSQIIEERGDEGFREVENRVNAHLTAENSIIATGGSVVYGEEAMRHLKQLGTVIYLQLSCEAIQERLGDLHARGVSIRPGWTLRDLYNERVPLYEKWADITIDCEALMLREVVHTLRRQLEQREEMAAITDFLLRAKQATYAGKGPESAPSRPASHDLHYQEGELSYIDSYLGGERFAGEEAIWRGGVPIWSMNYAGRVTGEGFSGDFLKAALSRVPAERPYRGPAEYTCGDYAYRCSVSGGFDWFHGTETITLRGRCIYECRFHGGSIR
ncbi:MAG: shikimate kinase [Clostridia bacterium]|nr:shikimate kinase [Clostridia bacterium]